MIKDWKINLIMSQRFYCLSQSCCNPHRELLLYVVKIVSTKYRYYWVV